MDRAAEMALQYLLLTYSYGINYRKNETHVQTIMSRSPRPQPPTIPDRYSQRFRILKREFQQLEYFCKGTLLKRMMKCGKAQCACRHDPAKRHGPYFEWTYNLNPARKRQVQGWSGFSRWTLASMSWTRSRNCGHSLSRRIGRFCGRVSSPGSKKSL